MLTPTEREAINAEVEQGTFDLENALDDIATEQKGEGVRRAIYGGIMLANKNGAGGPDLSARNRIADANGRIDAIESEMAQFIASHTGVVEGTRIVEDVLWTGNLYNSNDVAGLYAEIQGYDIRTYDYLDLYIKHAGKELIYRVTPNALLSDGIQLSATNLTNDTWTTELPLYASEYNLKATMFDDTWYSVEVDISVWEWSGKAAEASNQFANTSPTRALTKIVGIKHQAVDASKDSELTDMRVGEDGTVYASAGQALRAQVAQLKQGDEIDQLKNTLNQDLEPLIKYSNFQVAANNTHSATLDQLNISVSKGEVFYVLLSGLNGRLAQAFAYTSSSNYSLGAIGEGIHKFTATDNIVKIGLYVTSASTDADVHLGAFSNYDLLGKALGCQAYNIDAYSSHFDVASNSTHSTQIDQIFIDIASGEKFCLYVNGLNDRLGQVIAYNDDPSNYTVGNLKDGQILEFTASQNITRFGLFVTSGALKASISFIAFKSDSMLGKFSKMPSEFNALNIDAKSSHFSLSANSTHSEWSDEVPVDIKAGEKFCILLNGLGDRIAQGYAHNNGVSTSLGRLSDGVITELTASQDISRIGLYITSSATATDISIIVFKSDSLLGKLHAIPVDEYNLQYEVKLANGKRKANASGYNSLTSPEIFTIAHFSDIHGSAWAMREIKKFRETFGSDLDDTICTGDMVHDEFSDGMAFWDDASDGKILMCIGNHDSYNGTDFSTPVSQTDLYNTFIAPYKDNWGAETVADHTYWYKDYPTQKVRLIAVDATIFDATEQASQMSWFNNALSGALSNEYAVVGAIHFPPMPSTFQKIDSNFSALLHGTADDMWQFAWSTYNTAILDAVNDFINDGGDFVCWLSGHTHHDILSYDTRYPRQLFVTITCAMPDANGEERERNINDGTGLVLNTVCVDTVRNYVKLIRYGAEWDDCLRHTGTCVIKYDSSPATVMFYN